ncbi:CoA transferase subunit A [Fodinisporobacter ferrooxydans]|uniref:CoA transferase subunit A n=1 Tax=Fodinisporobacter ferrooxydans TaxID=2901836 RepID=A0ABY4CEV9_9BACL|nr:CoA transferase subunit A [Alicyclobacillaceae bacterium MYW30-H2]
MSIEAAQGITNVKFLPASEAVQNVTAGATVMVGGFGNSGAPELLLDELIKRPDIKDLTVISNNISIGTNLNRLFLHNKIRKAIGTYFTTNPDVVRAYREGRIEIELYCQGTFSEAMRLGGAGIPAFYTPTAAGTELAKGKEARIFDGRECVLERSLTADFALVRGYKADRAGNIVYRKTARNFNPLMAMAGKITIVEVDQIVEVGELDPEAIVTPFIFVDVVVTRGTAK